MTAVAETLEPVLSIVIRAATVFLIPECRSRNDRDTIIG